MINVKQSSKRPCEITNPETSDEYVSIKNLYKIINGGEYSLRLYAGGHGMSTLYDILSEEDFLISDPRITIPEEQQQISDIIDDLEKSLKFYTDRINYLQCWQSSMRDPERKIVCDILANGFTLTTKEEIENADKLEVNAAILAENRRVLDVLEKFADDEFELGMHSMKEVNEKIRAGTWPDELNPDIHYGEANGRILLASMFSRKIKSLRKNAGDEKA